MLYNFVQLYYCMALIYFALQRYAVSLQLICLCGRIKTKISTIFSSQIENASNLCLCGLVFGRNQRQQKCSATKLGTEIFSFQFGIKSKMQAQSQPWSAIEINNRLTTHTQNLSQIRCRIISIERKSTEKNNKMTD